jgi:NAD(P)H-hydrate epimerase
MSYILSSSEIRQWDQYTITNEPITSIDLMDRAAKQCSEWLMKRWDTKYPIVLFCGNGDNGGDGLAIARQLLENGYHITVLREETNQRSEDNQINLDKLTDLYKPCIHSFTDQVFISKDTILIDALFGTGLNRPIEGTAKKWIDVLNEYSNIKVSIDIPSGLLAEDSMQSGTVVNADFTLTFQCFKQSFLFPETGKYCGKIEVLDIGLHPNYTNELKPKARLIDQHIVQTLFQKRNQFAHKGTFGHSLLFVGSEGKMGASILATKACLRSGSGLTTVLTPSDQNQIVQITVPEAMTIPYETSSALPRLDTFSSIGIGCGLGTQEQIQRMIEQLILDSTVPLILDADALNTISNKKELLLSIPIDSLLTPHVKEFERLFGSSKNATDRYKLQQKLSVEHGIYILLKGKYSCVTTPNGFSFFNTTGNPGMAKGGSGDVLTGILTGLYASYRDMKKVAILGVYLHGLAGDFAEQKKSEESMLASDIIEELGNAFKHSFYSDFE